MPFVGANAAPARFWRVWPNRIKLGGRLRPDSESDAEGIAKLLLRERLDAAVFMKDDRSTGWFDGAEKASQETFRWKAIIVKSLPEFVLYHDELQLQLALGFQLGFQLNFKL